MISWKRVSQGLAEIQINTGIVLNFVQTLWNYLTTIGTRERKNLLVCSKWIWPSWKHTSPFRSLFLNVPFLVLEWIKDHMVITTSNDVSQLNTFFHNYFTSVAYKGIKFPMNGVHCYSEGLECFRFISPCQVREDFIHTHTPHGKIVSPTHEWDIIVLKHLRNVFGDMCFLLKVRFVSVWRINVIIIRKSTTIKNKGVCTFRFFFLKFQVTTFFIISLLVYMKLTVMCIANCQTVIALKCLCSLWILQMRINEEKLRKSFFAFKFFFRILEISTSNFTTFC